MTKECLGCGSVLQTESPGKEGFVKSSVYDKSSYCERCFKIKHYGEYSVLDKKIDTDGIIRNINSDNMASVAFLIDVLNINDTVKKYINRFKNRKMYIYNKFSIFKRLSTKNAKFSCFLRIM